MDSLLTPDFGLVFWTVLTFLLLVVVLGKFAWKPLLLALDAREQGIRRAIDDAASARQTAEGLKSQLEAELAAARDKTNALIAQAQGDAQKIRDKIVYDAEQQVQRTLDQSRQQIEQEKEKALQDLRKDVLRLSLEITEKILRQAPGTLKDQTPMVEGFLKD